MWTHHQAKMSCGTCGANEKRASIPTLLQHPSFLLFLFFIFVFLRLQISQKKPCTLLFTTWLLPTSFPSSSTLTAHFFSSSSTADCTQRRTAHLPATTIRSNITTAASSSPTIYFASGTVTDPSYGLWRTR
eukprot:g47738.t1